MNLIYQAYGLPEITRQTIFSIVSLMRFDWPANFKVVIYTDNPNPFREFFGAHQKIDYVLIGPEQLTDWRGPTSFVHRVKIEILKNASRKFSGAIFYADGDTHFTANPFSKMTELTQDLSFMHVCEGKIELGTDPLSKKLAKFLKKTKLQLPDQSVIQIPASTEMWNAGFIGLHESNTHFFDTILKLTDALHIKYQKHVMEQLAVSFQLQTHTVIKPFDDVLYHYWNAKPQWQASIDGFLRDFPTAQLCLKNWNAFLEPQVVALPVKAKKSFWSRIFN